MEVTYENPRFPNFESISIVTIPTNTLASPSDDSPPSSDLFHRATKFVRGKHAKANIHIDMNAVHKFTMRNRRCRMGNRKI